MYVQDSGKEWTVCVQTTEPYVEPPNDADKEMVMSKLKNGKATGHYQNPAELKKKEVREPTKIIYELILKMWEEEIVPQQWKYRIICPIHRRQK
jgi:hypothetical protein